MTDGLRKSHLRKAPQVGLSEVGLPEGNHAFNYTTIHIIYFLKAYRTGNHFRPVLAQCHQVPITTDLF